MIQSLFTQLSKHIEFIQKQNYQLQREVFANRNSAESKNNNRFDSNIVPHENNSFHQMAATDQIILQLESFIKKPEVDNVINTGWRKKT